MCTRGIGYLYLSHVLHVGIGYLYLSHVYTWIFSKFKSSCSMPLVTGGLGRGTGATLTASLSNKSVKRGAGHGRGGSQLATSRPTEKDHAGVSGKSLCITRTHACTHTHTHTCTCTHTHTHIVIAHSYLLSLRQREFSCL